MNYKQAFQQLLTQTQAHNTRNEASIRGLSGDISGMAAKLKAFEEIVTELTPEEQAAFDALSTASAAVSTGFEGLDALTPPVAPTPTE